MTELVQRLNEMRDVVAVLLREYHIASHARRIEIFEHCKHIARAADQIVGALKLAVRQADHEAAATHDVRPEYSAEMARFAREGFHAMQHSASYIARCLDILRGSRDDRRRPDPRTLSQSPDQATSDRPTCDNPLAHATVSETSRAWRQFVSDLTINQTAPIPRPAPRPTAA